MGVVHTFGRKGAGSTAGRSDGPSLPPAPPPPYDPLMEARLKALETALPTLATKVDVAEVRVEIQKSSGELVRWIVGTAIGGIAVFVTLMTFVLNNAVPKAPSSAQQPIIINVPGASAAPAAPAAPVSAPR